MKNKIRSMRPIILLLLVFATLASCVVTAGAIGWSGSTTTGGVATSNADGKYSIHGGTTAIKCLVGYRFAAIKADGTLANPKRESLDVFIKERESYLDSGVWARMVPQFSKKRYFNSFGSTSATSPSYIIDAQSTTGAVGFVKKETEMYFDTALPGRSTSNLGAELEKWQNNKKNLKIIAQALGYPKGVDSMQTNDTITIEPLFTVEIDNENLCLTVAEMAYYGGQLFGWNNKGRNDGAGDGSNANLWGFIARFTNQEFGNALYNDKDLGLGWKVVTTGASSRVSFRACIQYGYGVGICYKQEDTRPDLECVEIFFVDSDKKVYADPMKLPASKTMYAIGVFRNNSVKLQGANFYAKLNTSSKALTSAEMMYATIFKPFSGLAMSYMTGEFATTGTKMYQSMYPGEYRTMVLMKITPNSSGSTGYVHAQTWLKGATSATTGTSYSTSRPYVESNTANNYKKVQYKFISNLKQDVGIEVLLTNSKGPFDGKIYTDTEMKSLPYGSVVQVWHKYYTNSGSDYPSSEYVYGYDQNKQGYVTVNGERRILVTKGEHTYVLVTAFRANSFSDVTRKGYVYLAGASFGDTLGETNSGNNSDSITWKAKCDVELHQIILEQLDANGKVVATWTRTQGKAESKPSIPYGAKVRIKYVYRNNSQDVLSVDGYKSTTISTANKFGSNYSINANKGTRTVTYGTFTANASGTVYGAVRVNGYTGTGIETNSSNNSLSFGYTVSQPKDLLVTQIRYVYKDQSGKTVTQTVANGSSIVPKFPHGVVVSVYYTFQNSSSTDFYIDGYYTVGTNGTRVKINNSVNKAVNYKLTAKASKEFYVGNIITNGKLGEGTYIAEVFQTGTTSASGETNTTNNKQTSTYKVYGDIEVTDIYFTKVGDSKTHLTEPASLEYGTEYNIWIVVKNNTPYGQHIDVLFKHGDEDRTFVVTADNTQDTWISANSELVVWADKRTAGANSKNYKLVAEAYIGGKGQSAQGECDVNGDNKSENNVRSENYSTWFYDVAITDIFFEDADDNVYGKGDNNSTSLLVGKTYNVYYTLTNNAPKATTVNVYLSKDASTSNKATGRFLRLYDGSTIDTKNGIVLNPKESITICVGQSTSANQNIGPTLVSGAVYIGESLNADREANTTNNTLEEQVVFKHDVSIEEVYLTPIGSTHRFPASASYNGYVDIPVGTRADIHYVLKNHTGKTINVNVYSGSTPKIRTVNNGSLVVTLKPFEVKDITLDTVLNVTAEQRLMIIGSVYREDYDPEMDPYEITFDDNVARSYFNGVVTPYLVPIKPNAPYREGTDVITSYYLYNPSTKAYTGLSGSTAEVRLTVKVKRTGNVVYEGSKFTVVPAGTISNPAQQLVYIKWNVPENYLTDTDKFEISADLVIPKYPGIGISHTVYDQDYISNDIQFTPDTQYEEKAPDRWTRPKDPLNITAKQEWKEWSYEGGKFVQHRYGVQSSSLYWTAQVTSISDKGNIVQGSQTTKSGYGIEMNVRQRPSVGTLAGCETPNSNAYTGVQYVYAAFPEFKYSREDGCIATLEQTGPNGFKLCEFMDYGRVHWIPIWYPDGLYKPVVCGSDIWTPMGMIESQSATSGVRIEGTMYDDWYIGHG